MLPQWVNTSIWLKFLMNSCTGNMFNKINAVMLNTYFSHCSIYRLRAFQLVMLRVANVESCWEFRSSFFIFLWGQMIFCEYLYTGALGLSTEPRHIPGVTRVTLSLSLFFSFSPWGDQQWAFEHSSRYVVSFLYWLLFHTVYSAMGFTLSHLLDTVILYESTHIQLVFPGVFTIFKLLIVQREYIFSW